MTNRLPIVGSDNNTWATILNLFLQVGHNATGTLIGIPNVFNVKDDAYGATGGGAVNDQPAIAAAIAAAIAVGGGIVYFPPGNYLINSAISLTSAPNIILMGAGKASVIVPNVTSINAISGTDVTQITIKDLCISGPGSGTGMGVKFILSSNPASTYITMDNVVMLNMGSDGINIQNPIVSTFNRVISQANAGYGFNLQGQVGGASGTSTTLTSCYANGNTGAAGYRIFNMTYSVMNGCAADSNVIGYLIDTCQGVALNGCGAESQTGNSLKVNAGVGINLNNCWVYSGTGAQVYVTGSATKVTLMGVTENSPAGGATSFIKTDVGAQTALINCRNITANSISGTNTTLV